MKVSTQQENIAIVSIYAPNKKSPKTHEVSIDRIRREKASCTIIFGDFNTPLSKIDRTSRQKFSKEIEDLNNTINQQDLYRTCHTRTAEYIHSPQMQRVPSPR